MENIRKKIEKVVAILLFITIAVYACQVIAWAKEDEKMRKESAEEYCTILQDNPEQLAFDLVQMDFKYHKGYCKDLLYGNNSGVYSPSTPNNSDPNRPLSKPNNSDPNRPLSKPNNPDPDFHSVDEYNKLIDCFKMNPKQQEKGVAIVKEYLSTGKLIDISEDSTNNPESHQDASSVEVRSVPTTSNSFPPKESNKR